MIRGDYFRFGSVFIKKKKPNLNKKKKTKPVQTYRFWFGFSGLARFFWSWLGFFRFWLSFCGLALFFRFDSVFLVWLDFFGLAPFWLGFGSVFSLFFGLVRFFLFFAYKIETERAGFFKILIVFFTVWFFRLFFFRFFWFFSFFAHLYL
jgi:hypothetical protein